jgi:hypothetical protein
MHSLEGAASALTSTLRSIPRLQKHWLLQVRLEQQRPTPAKTRPATLLAFQVVSSYSLMYLFIFERQIESADEWFNCLRPTRPNKTASPLVYQGHG